MPSRQTALHSRRTELHTRRTALKVVAGVAAGLAGCSRTIEGGPEGSADLILVNETDSPVTVSLTVTDGAGATLHSGTHDVPVHEGHGDPDTPIEDVFETDGRYTVAVEVEDGPSATKELHVRSTQDDADLHQIYVEDDRIEFS